MATPSPSPLFKMTKLSFYDAFSNDPESFFFASSNKAKFNYRQLHDGFKYAGIYYSFISENYYLEEYLKKIDKLSSPPPVGNVFYRAEFKNNLELGCNGSITVLGRYFGRRYPNIEYGSEPRGKLSWHIWDCKKIDNFINWNSELVEPLKNYLVSDFHAIMLRRYPNNNLLKNPIKTNVIITSIPNADGKNRFSSFLNKLEWKKNPHLENVNIVNDLFIQTRKADSTRGLPYKSKMEKLKGLYKVNKNEINKLKDCNSIVILDDVITSGAHFELCLEALKNENISRDYEVHGVFLAATQSTNDDFESGIDYEDGRYYEFPTIHNLWANL